MGTKADLRRVKKDMKYIIKGDTWYKLVYADVANKHCIAKKVEYSNNASDKNANRYEDVKNIWDIELREEAITPDQYFFMQLNKPGVDLKYIRRAVSNRTLINYVVENRDKCTDVIDKLKEIMQTHDDYDVRLSAYQTCKKTGIECEKPQKMEGL